MNADGQDFLFRAYVNELAYLRNAGDEFSHCHPKLARRLEMGREGSADPQVQRLIESFAFLTARIQREIDADFPLIPAALLNVLYPHLTAPTPSLAIARFDVDAEHSRAAMGIEVPRETSLFATAEDGLTCRFRTCYPVALWPLRVSDVALVSPSLLAHAAIDRLGDQVAAVMRVRLECIGNRTLSEMTPTRLRFYIDADQTTAGTLYEVLCNRVGQVWICPETGTPTPTQAYLEPVGFAADEGVLPHPQNAHQGYRLIQEYFVFPQKYRFLDLVGLPSLGAGKTVDLLFLLKTRPPAGMILEPDTLLLGCTPIVNLFERTSEPIRIDHTQAEYRLDPDMRHERSTEVHTILNVSDTAATATDERMIEPFFSISHHASKRDARCYWIARRAPAGRPDLPGTQMYLSFKDLDLQPSQPRSPVLFAHTLCTNRYAAEQIPAGTALETELGIPVRAIVCQTRPTPQLSPPEDGETLWQMVSHLSLNHMSLCNGDAGLDALKEILRLYGGLQDGLGLRIIDALETLSTRPVVKRIGADAWRGFCRGIEVTLGVDDETSGLDLFLFTAVLSRFLGLYCGVNTFVQLVVNNPRRREGAWITWPPISGDAIVL